MLGEVAVKHYRSMSQALRAKDRADLIAEIRDTIETLEAVGQPNTADLLRRVLKEMGE